MALSLSLRANVYHGGPSFSAAHQNSSPRTTSNSSSCQNAVKLHAGSNAEEARVRAGGVRVVSPRAGNRRGRMVCNGTYKVRLVTPGEEFVMDAPDDAYLLDTADEYGLDLPYSCRSGSCSACLGKIDSGEVDQSEGVQLSDEQLEEGYLLICVSCPRSDSVNRTHQEEAAM